MVFRGSDFFNAWHLQVEALYDEVDTNPDKANQFYMDAWDLRRLFTFAWGRQRDAEKRQQVPRESCSVSFWHVFYFPSCFCMQTLFDKY